MIFQVAIYDNNSGHTYLVKGHDGSVLFTHGPTDPPMLYNLYSAAGTGWVANASSFLKVV
jgi:hypothetical protein